MKKILSTLHYVTPAMETTELSNHVIQPLGEPLSAPLLSKLKEAARFVGSIRTDMGVGSCFLCEGPDQKEGAKLPVVIVPLHVICDIKKLLAEGNLMDCFSSLEAMKVDFIGIDKQVHSFGVSRIINDGVSVLANNCSLPSIGSFDFAILELTENPMPIVGIGFPLDKVNHFGTPFSVAPTSTIALSRGYLDSENVMTQYYDKSKNASASSSYYTFSQEGYHHTVSGDSGKVILQFKNNQWEVYSMNLGVSSGYQIGLKMETLRLYWHDERFSKDVLTPRLGFRLTNIYLHLDPIKFTCAKNNTIVWIESHQGKHTINGWPGYKGKTQSQFSKKYDVSPTKLDMLMKTWETFDPSSTAAKTGYWHVPTSKAVDSDGDHCGVTIQWARVEKTPNTFWIHAYPDTNHTAKTNFPEHSKTLVLK